MTTHHLKLTNTTEIPHHFRLLVSKPFSVSQDGASRSHRAPGPGWKQECEEETGKQLVLYPQENMLVSGRFCSPCPQRAHSPRLEVTSHKHSCLCTESTPTGLRAQASGLQIRLCCALRALLVDTLCPANTSARQTCSGRDHQTISVDTCSSQAHETPPFVPSASVLVPSTVMRRRPSPAVAPPQCLSTSPFPSVHTRILI